MWTCNGDLLESTFEVKWRSEEFPLLGNKTLQFSGGNTEQKLTHIYKLNREIPSSLNIQFTILDWNSPMFRLKWRSWLFSS